ncbi:MAG: hypothetical protein Q9159_004214 [Coniocarpon cinnabarinum]
MASAEKCDEVLELVIIGSGISGLCAAKTYQQLHPSTQYAILEAEKSLGGVWATDHIYPNLHTNNLSPFFEYSDFPASAAGLNIPSDKHIPGKAVNQYLTAYAKHFQLNQHIRYGQRVQSAEYKGKDGWLLTVASATPPGGTILRRVLAQKLIVGAGLCSRPKLPSFEHLGGSKFSAPIFHGRDMGNYAQSFKRGNAVMVYGGTKMAWDAAYAYASEGVKVHWLMRKSGHGPCWMAPGKVTPLKLCKENLVMTRLLTWFSPCIWGGRPSWLEQWTRDALQRTWLGRKMVKGLFGAIQGDIGSHNNYDRCAETAKLRPWTDWMSVAGGQGVLSFERDIFGMVESGQIQIHIDEITELRNHDVHLQEAGPIHVDAMVCCTGWDHTPSIKFLPEGVEKHLGLPYFDPNFSIPDKATSAADEAITTALPILKHSPAAPVPRSNACAGSDTDRSPNQPYRLYRFMAPQAPYIHDRNIAFLGMQINFGVPLTVQIQALWIAAYFNHQLPSLEPNSPSALPTATATLPPDSEKPLLDSIDTSTLDARIRYETLLHTEFCKLRFPWGFGARFPDFVFELVPYLDMLLTDLGLDAARKMQQENAGIWGWIRGTVREALEPYGKSDYVGLVEEWARKRETAAS